MPKKKKKEIENSAKKPKVNPELEGFDITINSFGEIMPTHNIDKLNQFLNKHIDDKKLRNRKGEEE
jgi:hypothetical protein